MSLRLVIGPANAEKARVALDAYREALAAGREPLLVVPTLADVDAYRRELAASGAVFGVRVERFGGLLGEIARRTGVGGRPLGDVARRRVAALAVADTRLDALAASAATPGFDAALLELVAELEELREEPPRVIAALRRWGEQEPGRAAYAAELGALYGAYRRTLERARATDRELHDAAALEALRRDPACWGATPLVVYGFDDLAPVQRDAIETLACHAGAEVTLTLTYERGRTALAARLATFDTLGALPGAQVTELEARPEHYAAAALHHLERTLYEQERADSGDGQTSLFDAPAVPAVPAGAALRLLEGGDPRAELELVAAEVAGLLAQGWAAEEIAVVWRRPADFAALAAEVFADHGVPIALTRRLRARDTALGRGLLALLRCALLEGSADDLLTWLRTPGLLEHGDLADRLEVEVRTTGVRSAARARGLWERDRWPLEAIDRVADAHRRGGSSLCERLAREARALLDRPHRMRAALLDDAERADAAAAAALGATLRELGRLAGAAAGDVADPAALERLLGELPVLVGDPPGPGRVQLTGAAALRARRVRALFVCGLVEGSFPAPAAPRALLSDDERAAIEAASGLRLARHGDHLAGERFLLYAAVSRPTELLALSWHAGDEDGEPTVRSLFVDDVVERFADDPLARVRRRALGAAGWAPAEAPTPRQADLYAAAAAPPAPPAPLGPLSAPVAARVAPGERALSATALEAWVGCPVRWFVERALRPRELVPDPEPLVRGKVAHAVLRDVFAELAGRPLASEDLPRARATMHDALRRHADRHAISVNRERLRAAVRRLEADLVRHLEHAARDGSEFAPTLFEHEFDVDLGPLRLQGRIDRVDVHDGQAVVVDYKGASATPVARWLADRRLQLGLYVLAARELAARGELAAAPVGGLYQPIGGDDPRPRGALLADADPGRDVVGTDRLSCEQLEDVLARVLDAAAEAVAQLRAGALEPRPRTCAWQGGCSYPTICRCDG